MDIEALALSLAAYFPLNHIDVESAWEIAYLHGNSVISTSNEDLFDNLADPTQSFWARVVSGALLVYQCLKMDDEDFLFQTLQNLLKHGSLRSSFENRIDQIHELVSGSNDKDSSLTITMLTLSILRRAQRIELIKDLLIDCMTSLNDFGNAPFSNSANNFSSHGVNVNISAHARIAGDVMAITLGRAAVYNPNIINLIKSQQLMLPLDNSSSTNSIRRTITPSSYFTPSQNLTIYIWLLHNLLGLFFSANFSSIPHRDYLIKRLIGPLLNVFELSSSSLSSSSSDILDQATVLGRDCMDEILKKEVVLVTWQYCKWIAFGKNTDNTDTNVVNSNNSIQKSERNCWSKDNDLVSSSTLLCLLAHVSPLQAIDTLCRSSSLSTVRGIPSPSSLSPSSSSSSYVSDSTTMLPEQFSLWSLVNMFLLDKDVVVRKRGAYLLQIAPVHNLTVII